MRFINKKKLGLAILILTLVSAGTLWAKYEPQADLASFYENQPDTEELTAVYHERMNEFFNEKIDLLVNSYGNRAVDLPPAEGEQCTQENVSTYCVAEQAVNEFFAFQEAMLGKKGTVELNTQGDRVLITELGAEQTVRINFIDKELAVAFETMDVSLRTYNELHRAYPLHKKYQEVIKELERYRDMLADIRHEIEFFPNKFIDVSTTQCQ